jgi:DNA-binding response OmpR family regulator
LVALASEQPDVLIVDLHLPDVSGLDLVAKARQRLPDAPVLVVTASDAVDDAVKAIQAAHRLPE